MSTEAGSQLIQSVFVERQAELALDTAPRSAPSRSQGQRSARSARSFGGGGGGGGGVDSGSGGGSGAGEPRSAIYSVAPRRTKGFVVRPNDAPAKVRTSDDPSDDGLAEGGYNDGEERANGDPSQQDAGDRKRRARSRRRRRDRQMEQQQQQQQQQQVPQQPEPPALQPPPSPEAWKPGAFGSTPSFLGGRDGQAPSVAAALNPAPTLHRTQVNLHEVGQANLEGLGAGLSRSFLGRTSNNVALGAARGLHRAPADDIFGVNTPLPPLGSAGAGGLQIRAEPVTQGALKLDADISHFLKTAPIGPQAMAMGRQLLRHLLRSGQARCPGGASAGQRREGGVPLAAVDAVPACVAPAESRIAPAVA